MSNFNKENKLDGNKLQKQTKTRMHFINSMLSYKYNKWYKPLQI